MYGKKEQAHQEEKNKNCSEGEDHGGRVGSFKGVSSSISLIV